MMNEKQLQRLALKATRLKARIATLYDLRIEKLVRDVCKRAGKVATIKVATIPENAKMVYVPVRGKLVHISNLTDAQLERYIILREDLEDERELMNDALAGYDADY